MNIDPKVQRIIDWRESFVTLPDNHFFELIRMYLGEIHSPFNKQKLVEQLGAFLRKEENRKKIISLLSETDILILSAIYYIPNATNDKLSSFFSGTMNFASLYERLLNLEERLLIYRHADKTSRQTILSINPTLEDVLLPLLSKRILLPQPVLEKTSQKESWTITPEKIAGFINYISYNPGLCRSDGSIKKRDIEKLESIFGPGRKSFFQYLTNSLINLSLVKECSQGFETEPQRLNAFCQLEEKIQYAYLCVSSSSALSLSSLVKQGKLLLQTILSIPPTGFTYSGIARLYFLIKENEPQISPSRGRFSSILENASKSQDEDSTLQNSGLQDTSDIQKYFDCALEFGLIKEYGFDEKGEPVYVSGIFSHSNSKESTSSKKALNIDPAFSAAVFPGLPLFDLIELSAFMEIIKFDTAATFEISRKSVMKAFDSGYNASKIMSLLEEHSLYGVPENLKTSIDDWAKSYSSATIYKGYILKVDEENTVRVQNNPVISRYIYETLSPGIFLLNASSDEEAENIIKESGLDYIGKIHFPRKETASAVFPEFSLEKKSASALFGSPTVTPLGAVPGSLDEEVSTSASPATEEERKAHFDSMRSLLEKMNITSEQKEGLLLRINRKIILTPGQLNADSVKLEQIEANGMDYQGKIHVAESAITQNMMLELEYDDAKGGTVLIVGTPVSVEKSPEESFVNLIVEPEHEQKPFSLSLAKNVKRIRGNVLR